MFEKFVVGLALGCASAAAFAQTASAIQAPAKASAYAENGNGSVMRSSDGLCWRTGYWTPEDSLTGCDGELVPPVAKPIAPPIVATTPAAVAPAPATPVAAVPARCDFTMTLAGDQIFAFDQAVLTNPAKSRIDSEFLPKLGLCATTEAILVSGHTDPLGNAGYNQKLSAKRAAAIASYLQSKGVSGAIETRGLGDTQAIKTCDGKLSRKELVSCLAPNRRVELEVSGTAK